VSSVGARGARGGGTTSTALIYVRQSRHKEGERTVSPEVQEQQCRALPSVADCDQIDVFSDLDVSGGKLKGRKAFLALIDRVKGGGVTVVAAYDQSRGFRNTSDALDFYRGRLCARSIRPLTRRGIHLHHPGCCACHGASYDW
jgi:hypothetical protein